MHKRLEDDPLAGVASPQARSHILVVDDDELIRDFIGIALDMWGYLVTKATSAEEVLAYIRTLHFEVLVADFMLPGGRNGISLVEEIERIKGKRDFSVLVISAHYEVEGRALAIGATFLKKPFKFNEFEASITRLVGECEARRRDAATL